MADRETIGRLLGPDWRDARLTLVTDDPAEGALRRLTFRNHEGEAVPALWLPSQAGPTVLYCHAHGARYHIGMAELTDGRPALQGPWLPEFAARGWGVLCLEMPTFGARSEPRKGRSPRRGSGTGGRCTGRCWANSGRGSTGSLRSPGRTRRGWRSWASRWAGRSRGGWPRWTRGSKAAVSMCCFADLARLVETGAHDGHGTYMTVPGLLAVDIDRGGSRALPRRRRFSTASDSPTGARRRTPTPSRRRAASPPMRMPGAAEALRFHEAEAPGHEETVAMRAAVCASSLTAAWGRRANGVRNG
jgi:hypothetical protein